MADKLITPKFFFDGKPPIAMKEVVFLALVDLGKLSELGTQLFRLLRQKTLLISRDVKDSSSALGVSQIGWTCFILRAGSTPRYKGDRDTSGTAFMLERRRVVRRSFTGGGYFKFVDGLRKRQKGPEFSKEVKDKLRKLDFVAEFTRNAPDLRRSNTPFRLSSWFKGKDLWVLPMLNYTNWVYIDVDKLADNGWIKVPITGKVIDDKKVTVECPEDLEIKHLVYRTTILRNRLRHYATFMRNYSTQLGLYDNAKKLIQKHRQKRYQQFMKDSPMSWWGRSFVYGRELGKTIMQQHPDLGHLYALPYELALEAVDQMGEDLQTSLKGKEKAIRNRVNAAGKDLWELLQNADLRKEFKKRYKGTMLDRNRYPTEEVLSGKYEKIFSEPYILLSRTDQAQAVYDSHLKPFFESKEFKDAKAKADWVGKFAGQVPNVAKAYLAIRSMQLDKKIPEIKKYLTTVATRLKNVGDLAPDEFDKVSKWIDGNRAYRVAAHTELQDIMGSRPRKEFSKGVQAFGVLLNALSIIELAHDKRSDARGEIRRKFELAKEGMAFGATIAELDSFKNIKFLKIGKIARIAPVVNVAAGAIDYGLAMEDLYNGQVDADTGLLISKQQFAANYVCTVGKGAMAVGAALSLTVIGAPVGLVVTAIGGALELVGSLLSEPAPPKEFDEFVSCLNRMAVYTPGNRYFDKNIAPSIKEANDRYLNLRRVSDFKAWENMKKNLKNQKKSIDQDDMDDYRKTLARDVVIEYFRGEGKLAHDYKGFDK